MNIYPGDLSRNGYVELDSLGHKDLVPFIRAYMKKRTKFSVGYYFANLLVFGLAGYLFVTGSHTPEYNLGDRFTHFCYGLAIAFALVPIHEYIHVLAYRSQGAVNTSYDMNLKKFYFMALADQFVASRKEFQIVALAPFVVISISLLCLFFLLEGDWRLTVTGTLLTHTAMCSGDFGLLSYFEFHKGKELVTYDDISKRRSYFLYKTVK